MYGLSLYSSYPALATILALPSIFFAKVGFELLSNTYSEYKSRRREDIPPAPTPHYNSRGYRIIDRSPVINGYQVFLAEQDDDHAHQYWVYVVPEGEDLWFLNSNVTEFDDALRGFNDYIGVCRESPNYLSVCREGYLRMTGRGGEVSSRIAMSSVVMDEINARFGAELTGDVGGDLDRGEPLYVNNSLPEGEYIMDGSTTAYSRDAQLRIGSVVQNSIGEQGVVTDFGPDGTPVIANLVVRMSTPQQISPKIQKKAWKLARETFGERPARALKKQTHHLQFTGKDGRNYLLTCDTKKLYRMETRYRLRELCFWLEATSLSGSRRRGYPDGDILVSKYLMAKNNPLKMEKIAGDNGIKVNISDKPVMKIKK